jgi:hypothetical protein
MSDYSKFIALCPLENGNWKLDDAMPFELVYGDALSTVYVPRGFVTDGASIPLLLRVIFDRGDSRYMKAAILHDYMLVVRYIENGDFIYTTKQAALAFRDGLIAAKVVKWRVAAMWRGVRFWTGLNRP